MQWHRDKICMTIRVAARYSSLHYRAYYTTVNVKKVKVRFYTAHASRSLDRPKRFTMFLPWQTCSLWHQLDFSGKHSAMLQSHANNALHPVCSLVYSVRHQIELGVVGRTKMPKLRNGSKGGIRTRLRDQLFNGELPRSTMVVSVWVCKCKGVRYQRNV